MSNRIKRKQAKQLHRKKARLVTDPATGERWIEMDEEMAREMEAQLGRFKEKFGREPGPVTDDHSSLLQPFDSALNAGA